MGVNLHAGNEVGPLSGSTNSVSKPTTSFAQFKGALKAHKHISLYESYTLQEQDATILFLSVIP